MIKIGFDAKHIFQESSGVGNYGRSTVELLSRYYSENEYTLISGFYENRVNFSIPKGVKVVQPKGFLGSISPPIWRDCAMSSDIRRSRVDIYHGLANQLPLDIRSGGAKSVVTIHDLIFLRYPNLYPKMQRTIMEWRYKKSCSKADMILATSHQTKNDLMEFWQIPSERIEVVYQGCNPIYYQEVSEEVKERVRNRYKLPEKYILSIGVIEERKNLMLTLHAISEGKIDVPLVACGRWTPYVDKLKLFASQAGIADKVHFYHDCELEELPAIYKMASVVVYISLFEGFGIPILESLSCGTPIITSKGGVFDEISGDAALQVGPYDMEELIVQLRKVISEKEYRNQLIERGYKHIENFHDSKIADNLMALYDKMA
ncbi:MAG: glycosyltransferase family 1 protein [Rikenellaceae bacterium]